MHKIFELFLKDLETHRRDQEETSIEKYHVNCWRTCKAISVSIEKLKIAEEYVRFSCNFIPPGKDSNIGDYIEFHIENYMIRSRTIYDRVLVFTNCLCDIGKPKKDINHNAIVNNQKVIELGLNPKLKLINKACSQYRTSRNTIIHHDKYENENLEWVTVVNKAKESLGDEYEKILGISKETIISNTASVIIEHMKGFDHNTKNIISSVDYFLDEAFEIYRQKSEAKPH